MSEYVHDPKTLKKIKWVQPRYQIYYKHLYQDDKLSVDIHDLGYRKDFGFDSSGNSFIAEINKNTYRIRHAFLAPGLAIYDEYDEDGEYIEDFNFDTYCFDIKLPEPILGYICVLEPASSGDMQIAETKNYFVDLVSMITRSKKNLNISREIKIIPNSEFVILSGELNEKNINLKPIPADRKIKITSNFPTKEQWINVLRKALKSGNTSEANIKKLAGDLCIPIGDREWWFQEYLHLDITKYSGKYLNEYLFTKLYKTSKIPKKTISYTY